MTVVMMSSLQCLQVMFTFHLWYPYIVRPHMYFMEGMRLVHPFIMLYMHLRTIDIILDTLVFQDGCAFEFKNNWHSVCNCNRFYPDFQLWTTQAKLDELHSDMVLLGGPSNSTFDVWGCAYALTDKRSGSGHSSRIRFWFRSGNRERWTVRRKDTWCAE